MKIVHLSSLLAALAFGCFTAGIATAAPVLLNGSFEDPAVTVVTGGGGTAWTTTAGSAFRVPNTAGYGATPYGTQFLGLNGASGVSQTIAGFQAGTTYFVGFDYADLFGNVTPTLVVTLSGVFNYAQTYSMPSTTYTGTTPIQYLSNGIIFTPTVSGTETLTFLSGPTSGITVDNVSLYGFSTPVPEPTSLAAILVGAGALSGTVIRRRLARRS